MCKQFTSVAMRLVTAGMRGAFLSLALALPFLGMDDAIAAEPRYKLGVQDRLRIHVYEWPALTGEFNVGASGGVALPLIGEVPAVGLETSEFARAISDQLKAKARLMDLPDTAVDVIQYRPFYIIGGVERPGEYAYRPGMVVLNAVSIAGGVYRRPEVSGWASERDAINGRGDLQLHRLKRQELLAKETRLKAEAAQLDAFPDLPPGLPAEALGFMVEERAIFMARRERFQNELATLKQSIGLYQKEIEALKGQSDAAEKQRESVKRELADVVGLVSRGLTPAPRVLPLERTVAQIEREQKEIDTAALRARQQINLAERLIGTLRDERVSAAASELQTVQAQLKETAERQAIAQRIIDSSEAFAPERRDPNADQFADLAYTIVRKEAGELRVIEATETTSLQPGDIVKVQLRRLDSRVSEAGGARRASGPSDGGAPAVRTSVLR